MTDLFEVPSRVRDGSTGIAKSMSEYTEIHADSISHSDEFWLEVTKKTIDWKVPPTIGLKGDYRGIRDSQISWFSDGKLNASTSCLCLLYTSPSPRDRG